MNKISINLLTNIVLLLAGIVLVLFFRQEGMLLWVSRVLGVLFLLPALVFLAVVAVRPAADRSNSDYLGIFPAIGGLCFGVMMLVRAELFAGVMALLMGVLLLALGLFHVVFLFLSRSRLALRWHYFLLPLAIAVAGVLILALPALRGNESLVILLCGVCLVLFNITSLQEHIAQRKFNARQPDARKAAPRSEPADDYLPVRDTEQEDRGL